MVVVLLLRKRRGQLLDIERVGYKFAVFRAAESGRVDIRGSVGSCYQRVLTHILERRPQFTSWIRHQVKMTVLHVLQPETLKSRDHGHDFHNFLRSSCDLPKCLLSSS